MSVRDGLLTILSLGPAYGLQLHGELASRTPHRGPVNVGQIYTTLERLRVQGQVVPSGVTTDGLPLYALTEAGAAAVSAWLGRPRFDALPEWTEMLDQVLIAASVDPPAAVRLVDEYLRWWELDRERVAGSVVDVGLRTDARLAQRARLAQADGAIGWLTEAGAELSSGTTYRPYSADRPRRGRRRGVEPVR